MAAGQERRDEVVDDLVLPHDPAGDLRGERGAGRGELAQQLDIASAAGVVDRWGVRGHGRPGERKAEINACAQRF
jgi:hypothetical protein